MVAGVGRPRKDLGGTRGWLVVGTDGWDVSWAVLSFGPVPMNRLLT